MDSDRRIGPVPSINSQRTCALAAQLRDPDRSEGFEAADVSETRVVQRPKLGDLPDEAREILVTIWGPDLGRKFDLDRNQEAITIGRDTSADIRIDDDSVSRLHCKLAYDENRWEIEDLSSTNGTYVAGKMIARSRLRDGDQIKTGGAIFKFLSASNVEAAYHEEIYRMAIFDGLTQINNRRYFEEFTDRELYRARRHKRDLSLVIFDIDHFKTINDKHGHLAGDNILRSLAAAVRPRIRREELLARYAGDEFVVVLPETSRSKALRFGEMLKALVAGAEFRFENEQISVTISVGIGSLSEEMRTTEELIAVADAALYRAKQQGRNMVCA